MSNRTGLAIGVAVGLSAVPFVFRPAPLQTPALVLTRDLPAGARLTLDDFAVRDVAATVAATSLIVPGQAAELAGRPLRHALHAGDLLREVDVAGRPDPVPEGFRHVTLPLDDKRAGGAARGDRVDVLAVGKGVARTLIDDAEVREVVGTTVTLRVRAGQAEALLIASEEAVLWLSLRNPGDDAIEERPREVTVAQLLRPDPPPRCRFRPLQLIRGDGKGE